MNMNYAGKTALVTGASSGIGEVFARELAQRGANLILVARSESKLQSLATELSTQYGIRAIVIALDLSVEGAAETLYEATVKQNLTVDILINNAGFATYGYFEELPLARQHNEIMLNVTALVDLTHLYLTGMVTKGDGAIINVSSTAGFQPDPYMAVYGATKAFVLSFTEALWEENRQRGIRILALCPGATETPFFDVVGDSASVGQRATPEAVVQAAFKAIDRNKSFVIEGRMNNLLAMLPRFLPRQTAVKIVGQMLRTK